MNKDIVIEPNSVLEAILSGYRVTSIDADRQTGKTENIVRAVHSLPDKEFLVIVTSSKEVKLIKRRLNGVRNCKVVTCRAAAAFDNIRGIHPDIIIIDDFLEVFRVMDYDISGLHNAINYVKRDNTQLIKVG